MQDPQVIADDDHLRSREMQRLIHSQGPTQGQRTPTTIPPVLIQFWDDAATMPADVRECVESWSPFLSSHGLRRLLFDDAEARKFIHARLGLRFLQAFDRCGHPAMRSDYFRLCYLAENGGVYIDADDVYQGGDCQFLFENDDLKLQPLCYDNSLGVMVEYRRFSQQDHGSTDWTFYVNNNPLVTPASHPVIRAALARSTRMLLANNIPVTDIQSVTGPGNLSASLVQHNIRRERLGKPRDFAFIAHWDDFAVSRWPLSYRLDARNWRLWTPP